MTYTNTSELPLTIRDVLPLEAQELYISVYNEALDIELPESAQTMPRESMAHQMAWDAVTREFVRDEQMNQWHRIGEELMPAVPEHKGLVQRIRSLFQPASV